MSAMSIMAPQASKRVLKDIQRVNNELHEQGIWYWMDDTNITRGKALIRGPSDTCYEGCLLVFSVEFPPDYPFSPPKVLFLTSDGQTRFHPNLYVQGKVCLSILGTYPGPSWSGTQSLSSVFMSILALLDKNPLAHEPSYQSGTLIDPRHRDYADVVEHQMIKLMIESIRKFEQNTFPLWEEFQEIVQTELPSLKKQLAKKILEKKEIPERLWASVCYGMSCRSFWKTFAKEVSWIAE